MLPLMDSKALDWESMSDGSVTDSFHRYLSE